MAGWKGTQNPKRPHESARRLEPLSQNGAQAVCYLSGLGLLPSRGGDTGPDHSSYLGLAMSVPRSPARRWARILPLRGAGLSGGVPPQPTRRHWGFLGDPQAPAPSTSSAPLFPGGPIGLIGRPTSRPFMGHWFPAVLHVTCMAPLQRTARSRGTARSRRGYVQPRQCITLHQRGSPQGQA